MMPPRSLFGRSLLFGFALLTLVAAPSRADYLDDIGYNDLVARLAAESKPIPTGAGVTVGLVEPKDGIGNYSPNTGATRFSGITFTQGSPPPYGVSSHANTVAGYFFGENTQAYGVTNVTLYEANDWFANLNSYISDTSITNHSWVGVPPSTPEATQISAVRWIDANLAFSNHIAIGGVHNSGGYHPQLLGGVFNALSVGLTNGNHVGPPNPNPVGATGPLLVAPAELTSHATPMVSSAAALLVETGRSLGNINADRAEVIKAVLLAGATQDEFSDWSHTAAAPLDTRYGAGELNINHSHRILSGGQQGPGSLLTAQGWDYREILVDTDYTFTLSNTASLKAALTWKTTPAISPPPDPVVLPDLILADLNLYLYRLGPDDALTLVAESVSSVMNVEFLREMNLEAGDYLLRVGYDGEDGAIPYGLAWDVQAIPEPSTWVLLLVSAGVLGWRGRRRQSVAKAP